MRTRVSLVASAALITFALGGCPTSPPFIAPQLPAGIQFVNDHAALFTPVSDTPDAGATPVTDSARLAGCWGRVRLGNQVSGANIDVFEMLRLNPDGTARQESLLLNTNTGVSVLLIAEGTYTLDAAGSLTVTMTSFAGNNPNTGAIEPITSANPTSTTGQTQRSGDTLFITTTQDDGAPATTGLGAFNCVD